MARLETVIDSITEGVDFVQFVDISNPAEIDRLQVCGESPAIDLRDELPSAVGLRRKPIFDPRLHHMADIIDAPKFIFIIVNGKGVRFEISSDFAEDSRVVIATCQSALIMGDSRADFWGKSQPIGDIEGPVESEIPIESIASDIVIERIIFPQKRRTQLCLLINTSAKLTRWKVETDFRKPLGNDLEIIRTGPHERGNKVVVASINSLDKRIGKLIFVEIPWTEIADHLRIAPKIDPSREVDPVADMMFVTPF